MGNSKRWRNAIIATAAAIAAIVAAYSNSESSGAFVEIVTTVLDAMN